MKSLIYRLAPVILLFFFLSCNYVTYIPRSKTSIRREAPSVLLLDKIVNYRVEQNSWPSSKTEFTRKGTKYDEAFKNFPYTETEFKIKDNNTMTFYFNGHIKDIDDYNTYKKVNLNSYRGSVKFFKENNKFIWKLKMMH